jgi:hypothetical protein
MILGISAGDHFFVFYSPLPRIVRATSAVLLRGALLRGAHAGRPAFSAVRHCRPVGVAGYFCRPVNFAGRPGMHFPPGRAGMA